MQQAGRMRQCWRYNTIACEVGARISVSPSSRLGDLSAEEYKLLHVTLIRSYAFNSALSANIYQPACGARLELDRSVLDIKYPEDAILHTLLSFAEVQDVLVQETRKFAAQDQSHQVTMNRAASLKHQMKKIRTNIEKV